MAADVTSDNGSSSSARYKYQRLRERLRQAIESGELRGKLPGERELGRRYDANAKTINKALCDLTAEGLLVRHVGRGTFVADSVQNGAASRASAYLLIAPEACASDLLDELQAGARARGQRVDRIAAAVDGCEIPLSAVTPGQLRSYAGVIFFGGRPSFELLADLHRRHLPVVMVGNAHERIRTHLVLPDYAQGVFELTQHLIHLGHREIALLLAPESLPAASGAEAGYRAAVHRNGLRARPAVLGVDDQDLRTLLAGDEPATGVVCVGLAAVQSARDASGRSEWNGSGDVSAPAVCVLPLAGEGTVDNAVASYVVPREALVQWTTELLFNASPGQSPRTAIVPRRVQSSGFGGLPAGADNPSIIAPREVMI